MKTMFILIFCIFQSTGYLESVRQREKRRDLPQGKHHTAKTEHAVINDQPLFVPMYLAMERMYDPAGQRIDIFKPVFPFQKGIDRKREHDAQYNPSSEKHEHDDFKKNGKWVNNHRGTSCKRL
jgi:hypothetical protein